mgnify:CR=1 FL=1
MIQQSKRNIAAVVVIVVVVVSLIQINNNTTSLPLSRRMPLVNLPVHRAHDLLLDGLDGGSHHGGIISRCVVVARIDGCESVTDGLADAFAFYHKGRSQRCLSRRIRRWSSYIILCTPHV